MSGCFPTKSCICEQCKFAIAVDNTLNVEDDSTHRKLTQLETIKKLQDDVKKLTCRLDQLRLNFKHINDDIKSRNTMQLNITRKIHERLDALEDKK